VAAPPGPVDLSFNGLSMAAKARATGPEGVDAVVPTANRAPQHGRLSVDELRATAERQADAAANVRQGRAHPVLYDFLRDARVRLEAEATKLAESLPLGPSETIRGWGRGYLERVREHPGARHPSRDDAAADSMIDPHADALGQYNEAGRQAEMGGEQRTAAVCVDVQPGKPVVVRLKQSSQNADLDRLAVDSFERAGALRPVPAEVTAGVACYRVAIAAFRMPPLPSLAFGLKNGRPEVIYPLKRITKVTVELKSVDYGPRRGPPNLLR
jgi:hypothetical protein